MASACTCTKDGNVLGNPFFFNIKKPLVYPKQYDNFLTLKLNICSSLRIFTSTHTYKLYVKEWYRLGPLNSSIYGET